MDPLIFLLKLAWDCRYRLPLLITVGFMVLDIRMQLDVNIQMRQVPRPRQSDRMGVQNRAPATQHPANDNGNVRDDISEKNWKNAVQHVIKEENKMWDMDVLIDSTSEIEPLILIIALDSDDSSDLD